jgi:hypothetical protein
MWNFYLLFMDASINKREFMEGYLENLSVPLINFMNKAPDQFRQLTFNGNQSCIDLMFQHITSIFARS